MSFFDGTLNEPVWRECVLCKRETNGERCWDCEQGMLRATDSALECKLSLQTIPERYRWADRRHPQLQERVRLPQLAREFGRILAAEQAIITLTGQAGAGKSCLAAALMRAGGPALRNAHWMDAYELAEAPFTSQLGERAPMVQRAVRAELLVIDELRDPGAAKRATLTDVILRRHERTTARTIVTTGMTSQQIVEAFGEGVMRRLAAKDCAHVVLLGERKTAVA